MFDDDEEEDDEDDEEARPWKRLCRWHPYMEGCSACFDDAPPLGLSDVVLLAAPFVAAAAVSGTSYCGC